MSPGGFFSTGTGAADFAVGDGVLGVDVPALGALEGVAFEVALLEPPDAELVPPPPQAARRTARQTRVETGAALRGRELLV
jgi:hypothetical protein